MGISIDWGDLLEPLIATLIKAIIDAILKAIENGEFAKGMAAMTNLDAVAFDQPKDAVKKLLEIGKNLTA